MKFIHIERIDGEWMEMEIHKLMGKKVKVDEA
jgi:hypothetical protein